MNLLQLFFESGVDLQKRWGGNILTLTFIVIS